MGRAATVAACVLALTCVGGAAAAPGKHASPAGVTWGSHHFTTRSGLSSWLSQRGIRYEDWLLRHPSGGYLMSHSSPAGSLSSGRSSTSRHIVSRVVRRMLYGLAVVLLLVAVVPVGVIAQVVPPRYLGRTTSLRMMFAGGALSIAVGSALASVL